MPLKTFCDICDEEIQSTDLKNKVKLTNSRDYPSDSDYEREFNFVCQSCYSKINQVVDDLIKSRHNIIR